MRSFAQKAEATQQTQSAKLTIPGQALSGQSRAQNLTPLPQHTNRHHTGQQLPQVTAEERKDSPVIRAAPRFAYDFGRIPFYAHAQTRIDRNTPGDSCEQAANSIAERVMRIPEHEVAGSLDKVQFSNSTILQQRQRAEGRRQQGVLQRKGIRSDVAIDGHVESEIKAVHNNGIALPSSVRSFFEPRFGYDFAAVRIHTDSRAARLARNVRARAFTLDHNIVFGSGEYSPNTKKGKHLLAHELTHVIQQERAAIPVIQCDPDRTQQQSSSKPEKEAERDVFLRRLARWPGEAHEVWQKLSSAEQQMVLLNMGKKYGQTFSSEFLRYTKSGARLENRHYSSRAELLKGHGERARKIVNFLAPKNLRARGYRLATIDALNEWWMHPSGAQITIALEREKSPEIAATEETNQAASDKGTEGIEGWPDHLDPDADRKTLFGQIIAIRENADVAFGNGDMVLYEDGTIELFLEGTTESYVFRLLPSDGYTVYGPDGKRFDKVWLLPEEDIPDPSTDPVE